MSDKKVTEWMHKIDVLMTQMEEMEAFSDNDLQELDIKLKQLKCLQAGDSVDNYMHYSLKE